MALDLKLTMAELGRTDVEGYRKKEKWPVRFILDDVRSRHNVGSIFRTADAFGLEGIELCGFTPCPPHREIEKTALGATLSVPWRHHASGPAAVECLKAEGYTIWCVEQTRSAVRLNDWRPDPGERIALVLGNELNGVSDATIALGHGALVIPQHGTKHSLNVSVCAGVVLWQAALAMGNSYQP